MLKAIIIDDEPYCCEILAAMLEADCPDVNVMSVCNNASDALAAIRQNSPDIVFLDVEMPKMNGFEMLEQLPAIIFHLIFTTSYDQYALKAIRFSAIDYLLKPVNPEQLVSAIDRVSQLINEHFNVQMNALYENLKAASKQDKKIIIKTTEQIHLLDLKNIVSLQSDSCYTTVHTTEGTHIMVAKTLKEYEEMLTGCGFYRVHKSHLINLSHIKRFEKQDGGYIVLTHDQKIPVASRKREEMLELLEKMAE